MPLCTDKSENIQQSSPYGHPNAYIQRLSLQNRVFSHYEKYHYGKGSEAKIKLTTKPIFVTGCVSHLYWLKISTKGMSIFHNKKFYPLISSNGWTTATQKLINGFNNSDKTIFRATIARFFQTPEILKCQNVLGEKLKTKLHQRTEETLYSEEVLSLFKFFSNPNATIEDLKQWCEKHIYSKEPHKRSLSCYKDSS